MSITINDSDISGNLGVKKEAVKESELSNGPNNANNPPVKTGNLFGAKK